MSKTSFGKNTIIYFLGSVGLRFSSFLLLPLYTKYLNIEDFGLLQTLLLIIQIMITIIDVGVRSSIVRFLSEYSLKNKIGLLLGSSLLINVISSFVVLTISYLILIPIFSSLVDYNNITLIILLTTLAAIFQTLSLNILAYYRARNESIKYMLMSIGSAALLFITSIYFLVYLNMGIEGVLSAQIFTYLIVWAVSSLLIFSKHGLSLTKRAVIKFFTFGYPLIFAMSGDLITTTTAVFFLTYFHGLEDVAIYSLGFKIAQIATMVVIGPFQMAYEPYIYSQKNHSYIKNIISKLTTYLILSFGIVSFLLVYTFRDLIDVLFTSSYSSSYTLIFFILPGICLIGIQYVAQSMLHIKNKTKITGTTIAIVTILSIILNYISIKMLGITGLILAYNLTMGITALVLFKFGIKEFPVKFERKRLIVGLSIFIMLLTSVGLLRDSSNIVFYSIPMILFISSFSALFFSNYFTPNEKNVMKNYIANINSFRTKIFYKG